MNELTTKQIVSALLTPTVVAFILTNGDIRQRLTFAFFFFIGLFIAYIIVTSLTGSRDS